MGPKTKSAKQVRYLMSSGSPLSKKQKLKMRRELHAGTVKIRKTKSKKRG